MSTFLIGGGWDTAEVYEPFVRAVGGGRRIGCLIVDEGDGTTLFERYAEVLRKAGPDSTPVPLLVPLGSRFEPDDALDGVDGLLVCGGLTPAYQEALAGCLERLPALLTRRGMPYAGFSAGAAVAARRAVVGGWLAGGGRCARKRAGRTWPRWRYGRGSAWCPSRWTSTPPGGGRSRA
ncbi:hypothetical protein [Streptomyces sp. NPDC046759]|uniref:hypothetical protein n=1 Tax=Streptomyces sp. NPDC046759 TaxID=3155019 RepID=UPI0033D290CC